MADENTTNEQTTAAAPATDTRKNRGAKKAAAKSVSGTKVDADKIATAASDEAIDAEMKALDREIKQYQLQIAKRQVADGKFADAEKLRKREAAQASLRGEKFGERQTAAQCQHRLGGFGLEDTYSGDGPPAIAIMDMPIVGMRKVVCVRCPKVWNSPDPRLKKTNPQEYLAQAEEWKEALQLIKQSRIKAMGGPTFGFETQQGDPVHPTIV